MPRIATPTAAQLAKGSYGCGWAHLGALRQWQQRIAEARTVSEARELAAGPVRTARHALGVARIANPWSASLAKADTRLSEFERGVETSPTAADVAARFGGLVKIDPSGKDPVMLADLQVANVKVDGPGGCRYSTGEIVAIVIGFILFIIPGIILLVVLC
ncbi:MAG: hypothetical protein HY899_02065 [Deltaproteobacteria bacterium]|nr:hypothetical protein [Deltaproteobacteria bacterium]